MKLGTLRVRYQDGREVTYRSLDEMMRLRTMMQGDVSEAPRTALGTVRIYPEYAKGT